MSKQARTTARPHSTPARGAGRHRGRWRRAGARPYWRECWPSRLRCEDQDSPPSPLPPLSLRSSLAWSPRTSTRRPLPMRSRRTPSSRPARRRGRRRRPTSSSSSPTPSKRRRTWTRSSATSRRPITICRRSSTRARRSARSSGPSSRGWARTSTRCSRRKGRSPRRSTTPRAASTSYERRKLRPTRARKLFKDFIQKLKSMIDAGQLRVATRAGRLVIQLPNDVLFDSGQKTIKPAGKQALTALAKVLVTVSGRFVPGRRRHRQPPHSDAAFPIELGALDGARGRGRALSGLPGRRPSRAIGRGVRRVRSRREQRHARWTREESTDRDRPPAEPRRTRRRARHQVARSP